MKRLSFRLAARLTLAGVVLSIAAGGWLLACTNNPSSPSAGATPEGPIPTLTAFPAAGDPMATDVDSPLWKTASWTALTPAIKETRHIPNTRVASLYDAEHLYIAFVGAESDHNLSSASLWLDISAAQNGTEVYEITADTKSHAGTASFSQVWHRCVMPPENRDTPDYALPMSHITTQRVPGLSVRVGQTTLDGQKAWSVVYSIPVAGLPIKLKGGIKPGESKWKVNLIRQDLAGDPKDASQKEFVQTNLSPVFPGAQAVMPYRMASLVLAAKMPSAVAATDALK